MESRGGPAQPTRRRKRGDPLTPAQAAEAVHARVAANGSERLSLKGRTLDGPLAVRAACDEILTLYPPTQTLNLTGAEVCHGGANVLADFLVDYRCAVEELCLVDNPRLGVHMADTGIAARDIPDRGEDEPISDGAGMVPLARALSQRAVRLRRLNLGNCGLDDSAAETLAAALANPNASPSLESINLRSNDLSDRGVDVLAAAMSTRGGCPLKEIALANNPRVTSASIAALDGYLRVNRRADLVREAARLCVENGGRCGLRRRGLDDDDAFALARSLRGDVDSSVDTPSDSSVSSLAAVCVGMDLSDNEIGPAGVVAIADAVRLGTCRAITAVSVSGNPGGEIHPHKSPSTAAQVLHGCCAANVLRNAGEGEALKSVGDRGLGDDGAEEVARYLSQERGYSHRHRAVGLQHNDIGPRGARALAEALASLPKLDEVAMYSNRIGGEGARWLARMVKSCPTLRVLDVGGNGIGDAGCIALAEAIVNHPSMEELHLDHNGIGAEGAMGLLGAMQMTEDGRKGRGLRRVWLHGNDGVPEGINARVHAIAGRNAGANGERPERIPRDDLAVLEAWEDTAAVAAERDAAAAGGGTLPGGFRETSTLFANRVAAAAGCAYRRWFPDHATHTRGAAVIAAIVAHERHASSPFDAPGHGDRLRVLSLGSGTKFMPREVAAAAAAGGTARWESVVHDSHAEVLARRAFLRMCYREIMDIARESSTYLVAGAGTPWRLLEATGHAGGFRLRPGVTLHLYVSTAPCGSCSMPATVGECAAIGTSSGSMGTSSSSFAMRDVDDVPWNELWSGVGSRHEAAVFAPNKPATTVKGAAGRGERAPAPGVVFARLRDAEKVPGMTLSCSDKISRWQALGLQGAALSHLMPAPLAFDTVVVGRKFNPDRLRLGTCCALRGFASSAAALRVHPPRHCAALGTTVKLEGAAGVGEKIVDKNRADAGDSDESLTWARGDARASRHDGRTGGPVGGGGPMPACSRAALHGMFREAAAALEGRGDLASIPPSFKSMEPSDVKRAAKAYSAGQFALFRGLIERRR